MVAAVPWSQLLFSAGRALGVSTERTSISVIQREFSEKRRRLVRQNEVQRPDRTVLRENLSRANPEKTIQIARRFAAVQTTKLRMAIDPKFLSSTAKASGGRTIRFFSTQSQGLWEQGTCIPSLHGYVDQGSSRRARRCPTRKDYRRVK